MKLLSISQVKPGMRAAKAITDRQGATLAAAGLELTEGMIERMKSRRVEFVHVEEDKSDGVPVTASELEHREAEIDRAVDEMFAKHMENPVMAALAEVAKLYRKRKLR